MNEEIWKSIPFAPKHLASSRGQIMGLRDKPLVLILNSKGYLVVNLHKIQYRVNRIICHTFHGDPPSSLHHAAHRDSIKINNNENNLYWATHQENIDDLTATGKIRGLNHPRSLVSLEEIRYIRSEYDKGRPIADLNREFPGLVTGTVAHIARRISYRSVE